MNNNIERLIAKSANEELTAQEQEVLSEWIEKSPNKELIVNRLSDYDMLAEEADKMRSFDADMAWKRVQAKRRRHTLSRISYITASVAAAGLLLFTLITPQNTVVNNQQILVTAVVEPNEVLFSRTTGEVFAMDSQREIEMVGGVAYAEQDEMTVKTFSGHISALTYSTLEVPLGKQFTVNLDDGSRVTLNAGSVLKFPEYFSSNQSREVYLQGEAYFSVSKDANRPFIVHTGKNYVKVLGTEFNVSCYDDMSEHITTLVSGSVSVGRDGDVAQAKLTPGMQAQQDRETGVVTTRSVDVSEYTAWMTDMFVFRNRELQQIMHSISKWYGCQVTFENAAKREIVFTGKIPRTHSLEQVIKFFGLTADVELKLQGNKIIIR